MPQYDPTPVFNPRAVGSASPHDPAIAAEKRRTDLLALQNMTPEQRDAYLATQQQSVDNSGKPWADTKAYDAYATSLNQKYANDPNRATRVMGGIQEAQQIATNGWNGAADINAYQMGGDPAFAAAERARLLGKGDASQGRTGPVADTSMVQPGIDLGVAAGQGQYQMGGQLAGLAGQSAGSGLQGQAGKSLLALGQMPAGPSAAELAMNRQAGQAERAQASLAAGARGGNSALALQNAAANSAAIGGQATQDIGVQRAAEDLSNRQFAAGALGSAATVFGQQTQQQIGAGGAANAAYGGAGSTFNTGAGINAGIAVNNAAQQGAQMGRNDQREQAYDAYGNAITAAQTGLNTQYDQQRLDAYIRSRNGYGNPDNTGRGTITGSSGGDKLLGGLVAAGGAALAPATGGASAAVGVPIGTGIASSDIRAKTAIAPAPHAIDDTFRGLGDYGYEYRDPRSPGAAPGRHYGPMAQELERTPAGASTVTQGPGGAKGIDTGRLALVNASETARLRKELDALKVNYGVAPAMYDPASGVDQAEKDAYDIKDTRVGYPDLGPTPEQARQFSEIDRQAALRRRPQPTPLEFDPAGGGSFRDPLEQARYTASVRHPGGYGAPMGPVDPLQGYAYASRGP